VVAAPTYPFAPKSTAHLVAGQFWSIPLAGGRYGCGRVLSVPRHTGPGARTQFVAGLMSWCGWQPPTEDALVGSEVVAAGQTHINCIRQTGGDVLGHRPLDTEDITTGKRSFWSSGMIKVLAEMRCGVYVAAVSPPEQTKVDRSEILSGDARMLIEQHRAAANGATSSLGQGELASWLQGASRDVIVSVVIAAFSVSPRTGVRERLFTSELIRRVGKRRLPYSADDVSLLLDLTHAYPASDRLRYALTVAERHLDQRPGDPDTMRSLEHLLGLFGESAADAPTAIVELEPRVRALLARHAPGGLLDLTVLGDDDGFGLAARTVVEDQALRWDGAGTALAHFAAARGNQPTTAWLNRTRQLVDENAEMATLVRALLELVVTVDLTTTTRRRHGYYAPPVILLGETNTVIARGCVRSCRALPGEWRAPLLGSVALRCSASNHGRIAGGTTVTAPLCAKVALAAVEELGELSDPTATAQLRELFEEIPIAVVLRRVAETLRLPKENIQRRLAVLRRGRPRRR